MQLVYRSEISRKKRHIEKYDAFCLTLAEITNQIIVSRGDGLGNPANIKVENNGAVGYVGSSLTVHNPLFSVHKND